MGMRACHIAIVQHGMVPRLLLFATLGFLELGLVRAQTSLPAGHRYPTQLVAERERLEINGTALASDPRDHDNLQKLQLLGCLSFFAAFPYLWFNERQNARMRSLCIKGRQECKSLEKEVAVDARNRNCLVHIKGGVMKSRKALEDPRFKVRIENSIKLRTVIEVFQVINKRGKQGWSGKIINLPGNTYPSNLPAWKWEAQCDLVAYDLPGKAYPSNFPDWEVQCDTAEKGTESFFLPEALVRQCKLQYTSAHALLPDSVTAGGVLVGYEFKKERDGKFYHYCGDTPLTQREGSPRLARVGDARVTFEHVPEGPASLLAIQADDLEEQFLPYREIKLGPKEPSEAMVKVAQRVEGMKSVEKLACEEEASYKAGRETWAKKGFCCASCVGMSEDYCLVGDVQKAMAATPPQIYHMFEGEKDCFKMLWWERRFETWRGRVIGLAMMLFGSMILCFPDIYITPIVLTLVTYPLVCILAYAWYQPFFALGHALQVVVIAVAFTYLQGRLLLVALAVAVSFGIGLDVIE